MWNARRSLREWRIEDSPRQIRLTKGEARDIMGNDVREYTMRMVQEASAEANREATPAPPLRRPPGDSWKNLKHKMAMQSTAKSKEAARKQSLIDDWVNILGNVFQRNRSQPTLDTHTRGTETDDSDWSVTHSESNRDLSVGEEEHEEGPQHVGGAEASIRQMNSLAREQAAVARASPYSTAPPIFSSSTLLIILRFLIHWLRTLLGARRLDRGGKAPSHYEERRYHRSLHASAEFHSLPGATRSWAAAGFSQVHLA